MARTSGNLLLVSDFTIDGLAGWLKRGEGAGPLHVTVAPFGQVTQTLLDGSADCWSAKPEAVVVWTRPQGVISTFARLLANELVEAGELMDEVDMFAEQLGVAAARVKALIVPSWTVPASDRGLGLLNLDPEYGPAYHLMRMNLRLAERVAREPGIFILDSARWAALAGPSAANPKLWYLGKMAFGPEMLRVAAGEILAALRTIRGETRKMLVLDLDDTLWGGIIGDVGWENLRLGGHDAVGEAFRAFQLALRALKNRGILLAIVSKNTESVALEAIQRHPEMALRREDFVGWRINWNDKAQNILELVQELNLGLDSVVFIDDSPAERTRVRQALPAVLVPEWPTEKMLYVQALSALDCFDTATLSKEDRQRTEMYEAQRGRSMLENSVESVDQYVAALKVEVTFERLTRANLARTVQLLNKTNQMNLTTRRMSESEYLSWSMRPGNHVFVFRVADRFGDYGLTGIASLRVEEGTARVEDLVLSCRVMGRGVERAMLHTLAEHARVLGLEELVAVYVPTERNEPCRKFLEEESGLSGEQSRFCLRLSEPYPGRHYIAIRSCSGGDL